MSRPALYVVPNAVRVILCLVAASLTLGGFWLVSGVTGLGLAAAALLVRASLTPATLVRLTCLIKRRRAVTSDDQALTVLAGDLEALSQRAGCAVPALALVTGTDLNAFAIAGCRGNAIIVTEALLSLPVDERCAVLAHELGHLIRHDALLVSLLWIGPISLLAAGVGLVLGDPAVVARVAGLGALAPFIPNLLLVIASLTLILALALRSRLEWAADTAAVQLLEERRPLIAALERRFLQVSEASGRAHLLERLSRLDERAPL